MQYGKYRTGRGSWFIYNFFKLVYFNTHDSFRSGNTSFRSPSSSRVQWMCGKTSMARPVHFWNIRRVVTWTNQNPKTKYKWGSRTGTGKAVFRHARVVARIHREACGWESSWTQRLTREFFSWNIFRTFEKCGFGYAQCLYSLLERPKLRDLSEDQNHKGSVQKTCW